MAIKQKKLTLHFQSASRTSGQPSKQDLVLWGKLAIFNSCEVTVRLVDRREGLKLNNLYRHKDYPTNVLTFELGKNIKNEILGDIVLCCPVIKVEAKQQQKKLINHYAHLFIHGLLHLQGYDHQNAKEAKLMEELEVALLGSLQIPNPYNLNES